VYVLVANEPERFAREFSEDDLTTARNKSFGPLTYPKGSWAYPGSEVTRNVVGDLGGRPVFALIGLTAGKDLPLVATRAGLFGTSLDSGTPPPVYVHEASAEAIVVIIKIFAA
jgi:hypothetical protein